MRDFSADLAELRRRVEGARAYLKVDAAHDYLAIEPARAHVVDLEAEVSAPGLWDDQDRARKVTGELARAR
ncbi:MAG TPA: hypothetical protein VH986_07490, partial [Acidimicrobiia bacterium]